MKLKIQNVAISTGNILVALLNSKDAHQAHFRQGDRITLQTGTKKVTAVVDVTNDDKIVKPGCVGIFQELQKNAKLRNNTYVTVAVAPKPRSVFYIKKKLVGKTLTKSEIDTIIEDISNNRLTDTELTYFVSSGYIHDFSNTEVQYMTQAMVNNGEKLKLSNKIIMDKHCIGGVAANRTTCVVVPIIAAAGIPIPKTSSRSITSPAGTADTMEVLCNVSISKKDIERIVKKYKGCLVWGGGVNFAPADDKIIKVEHPMSLDPVGQLLASILAKKVAVGATHCLIDIPFGEGAKINEKHHALTLKRRFESIGQKLGIHLKVVITDGTEPIGNGIGPLLEARDIIWTLQNDPRGSHQLKEKAIRLAGVMLEMSNAAKKGTGEMMAREFIETGKAYKAFSNMVVAQGGKKPEVKNLTLARHTKTIRATSNCVITRIDNKTVSTIAKLAGAPKDKQAGIYLYHHVGEIVQKDDPLYTIYAINEDKLQQAAQESTRHSGFFTKKVRNAAK